MNLLDATILAVAVLFTLRGVLRGLVREAASLAGLLVGFAVASTWVEAATPWVARTFGLGPNIGHLVTFVLLLAGTALGLQLAARLVRAFLRLILLGWLDRLAGGALGLAKAGVLASIAVFALTTFLPPQAELLATSQLVPFINAANAALLPLVPDQLRRRFAEGRTALDRLRAYPQRMEEMLHGR